jgi:hypothetical protein
MSDPNKQLFEIYNQPTIFYKILINYCLSSFFRLQEQPRFPNYSKHHAHLFLHACIWNMDASKKAMKKYARIRAESPDIFDNRDPLSPGIQYIFSKA